MAPARRSAEGGRVTPNGGRVRRDWRDTVATLAELALVGVATTVAVLPLLTAGAAIATASVAVHHRCATGSLPPVRDLIARLRRALLPGAAASAVAVAIVAVLAVNAGMLARGAVPGGGPVLVATAIVALLMIGYAGLVVVEVGRAGGTGWRAAVGRAWAASCVQPWLPVVLGVVVLVAAFIGLAIPATVPILVGVLLFALHVTADRAAHRRADADFRPDLADLRPDL
ncbi:MAG TPA: hypothetical protein VK028_14220 [Micromonosporaceae bacterium]|nr:hypothetical protein [Micromonosporaceae bacterium]